MEAAISSSLSHPNIVQVRDRHADYMSRLHGASRFPLCLSLFLLSPYGSPHLINLPFCCKFMSKEVCILLFQTYTYSLKPIMQHGRGPRGPSSSSGTTSVSATAADPPDEPAPNTGRSPLATSTDRSRTLSSMLSFPSSSGSFIAGFEVQIVQEYCDLGSLSFFMQRQRQKGPDPTASDRMGPGCGLSYPAVLETALDVANGMRQLHVLNIVHSDCKV